MACDLATRQTLESPSKNLQIEFCLKENMPFYSVSAGTKKILDWSSLGFEFQKEDSLQKNFRIVNVQKRSEDQIWEQIWGEERFIRNHHHEMKIHLQEKDQLRRRMNLIFRAFDDGIGFRYELPEQPHLQQFIIMNELTEFRFLRDPKLWFIPAYTSDSYEQLYQNAKLSELKSPVHTPLTIEDGEHFYSLHEAGLIDYSSMQLRPRGEGIMTSDLAPWSDGTKVKSQTPLLTPWRTLQIGKSAGDLITSYLVLNLNEPNKLEDLSYIRPMKYIGIWWGMHLGYYTWYQGPIHGATTERAKSYIDSAVQLKIPGLLIEGWNPGWESWGSEDPFDFTMAYDDFDLSEVTRYARENGISIMGHHETAGYVKNYETQIVDAFALYKKNGVHSVKTGYVASKPEGEYHYGQYMVRHYQMINELAAQNQIMVNAHEPVKDTGLRRTYPNVMTREGARGNEYEAWAGPIGNPPNHTTIIPFTRGLSGPFDFTPGIFDLLSGARPGIDRVHTTLAKQLALFVVIYSPLHMAADLPKNYFGEPAFQFIQDVPVDWHTTRVLSGVISEHITVARKDRNSDDWYIGSITNEDGRELKVSLDFLDPGSTYCAQIYRDQKSTHWLDNPQPYEIVTARFNSQSQMALELRPGGGQAIRLQKCQ